MALGRVGSERGITGGVVFSPLKVASVSLCGATLLGVNGTHVLQVRIRLISINWESDSRHEAAKRHQVTSPIV